MDASYQRSLVATAVLAMACGGCNVIMDLEDVEPFPDNCGAESLTGAQAAYTDDRKGHCYSVVLDESRLEPNNPDNTSVGVRFNTAKEACGRAGGYLACLNDQEEYQLLVARVPQQAWLGMNAQLRPDGEEFSRESYSCYNEAHVPDGTVWQSDRPDPERSGGKCAVLEPSGVTNVWCGSGVTRYVCEFEPPVGDAEQ